MHGSLPSLLHLLPVVLSTMAASCSAGPVAAEDCHALRCVVRDDAVFVEEDVLADMLEAAGLPSDDDDEHEPPRKKDRCRKKGPANRLYREPGTVTARPAAVKKKPASAGRRDLCHGYVVCDGETHDCRFAADGSGHRARTDRCRKRCMFCDPAFIQEIMTGSAVARGNLTRILRSWQKNAPHILQLAFDESTLALLTDEQREALQRKLGTKSGNVWRDALQKRASITQNNRRATAAFAGKMEADRQYIVKKMFPHRQRRVRHSNTPWRHPMTEITKATVHDVAENDTGLPAAQLTEKAKHVELWCKEGSWAVCEQCGSVQARHLKENDTHRAGGPTIKACKNCAKPLEKRTWVPAPHEVPGPLRGLTEDVIRALRPLDIDCGPEWRAEFGYRFHSSMIRFSWAEDDVEDKIEMLPMEARIQARAACDFLMHSEVSSYGKFVDKHRHFWEKFPDPDAKRRKRPLQFIEEDGLECALWPHLYFDQRLCETRTRLSDIRRVRRGLAAEEGMDADEVDDPEGVTRQSLKRNFLLKAFGPIAEFAGDYELLHFVFDLSVWSDVGGKKEALRGMEMWQIMKGAPWTPQFWRVRHAAALDMQAQCGMPVAFVTLAPLEWSAPYHRWVMHQMSQLLRDRLALAGPESMHLAHILTELFREWIAGGAMKHGSSSARWQDPIFGGLDAAGKPLKVNFVGRLEFQDGKRKEATQDYHGRGAVHLHGLIFANTIGPMRLETKLSATVPDEASHLCGVVIDSQSGRTGSGWPVRNEENAYVEATDKLVLRHTDQDKLLGIRAYIPEVMDVLKCHQDVQVDRGTGLLLKYAATYLPKFSDGPGRELMDTASSAYGAARRVLFTFHPGEPEMWLQLAQYLQPYFFMGGTMRPIVAPLPGSSAGSRTQKHGNKCGVFQFSKKDFSSEF